MKVGVVVFSKNEALNISEVLDGIIAQVGVEQVCVVDASSTDQTPEIVRGKGVALYNDPGTGKGGAIRWAFDHLDYDYLILMDSDCSHQPQEIPRFLEKIRQDESVDMVIGSRFLGGSDEFDGNFIDLVRKLGNKLSVGFINLRWNVRCTDIQNGFRAVRVKTMRELNLTEDSFAIEQEMVMKCLINKKNIQEIPSYELQRKHGQPHLKTGEGLGRFIWSLFFHATFGFKLRVAKDH